MKICQNHWDKLRQALNDRGIGHLGAKSGEDAMEHLIEELEGTDRVDDYDPLMACNNMIWSQGLKMGGLYLMGQKEDGTEYCPICESIEHDGPPEEWWIDGPTDACLEHCRTIGLAPRVQ